MFHKSNFGSIHLPSDLDGYVPEAGDKHEDFRWEDSDWTDEQWDDFVERAVDATEEANKTIKAWRDNH